MCCIVRTVVNAVFPTICMHYHITWHCHHTTPVLDWLYCCFRNTFMKWMSVSESLHFKFSNHIHASPFFIGDRRRRSIYVYASCIHQPCVHCWVFAVKSCLPMNGFILIARELWNILYMNHIRVCFVLQESSALMLEKNQKFSFTCWGNPIFY